METDDLGGSIQRQYTGDREVEHLTIIEENSLLISLLLLLHVTHTCCKIRYDLIHTFIKKNFNGVIGNN